MIELNVLVRSLKDSVNGKSTEQWFSLPVNDLEEIYNAFEGSEELEVISVESDGVLDIRPNTHISLLNEIAEVVILFDDEQQRVLEALRGNDVISNHPHQVLNTATRIQAKQYILIEAKSLAEIAERHAVSCGHITVDSLLYSHVNFDSYAKDLGLDDTYFLIDTNHNIWVEWIGE